MRIPKELPEAEALLSRLEPYVGQKLRDETEPRLLLHVQASVASWRMIVTIGGKRLPRTFGRVGEITVAQARAAAQAAREHGAFTSQADYLLVTRRAIETAVPCLSVEAAFDAAISGRLARRRITERTAAKYRDGLQAAGEEFCGRPLDAVTPILLRKAAKAVHERSGKERLGDFRRAMWWAFAHGIETGRVVENLANDLKKLNTRDIETDTEREALTWEEVHALWQWLGDPRCPLAPVEIRLYRVMLIVGERIGSLRQARWEDIGEDGWWVIHPEKRKTKLTRVDKADPLFIYVTDVLREILGQPDGSSPWIFPAKRDPQRPAASLPLPALFRARDYVWLQTPGMGDLVPAEQAAVARRHVELRYTKFPIPDLVPRCCHHEAGRHTLSTLAQEEGIPGVMVSKMLGHADAKKLPGDPDLKRARSGVPIPRVMLRQAEAANCAASVTRRYYTHIEPSMPAIRAAWLAWTAAFCREAAGAVPVAIQAALDELRGPDDKILDMLTARFGDLEKALQAVLAAAAATPAQAADPILGAAKSR